MKYKLITDIKTNFAAFVNDKANHPTHDTYGTKYSGNVQFEHFVLYAFLRGANPEKTTHNVNSEHYKDVLDTITQVFNKSNENIVKGNSFLLKPFTGGLITNEMVISLAKESI